MQGFGERFRLGEKFRLIEPFSGEADYVELLVKNNNNMQEIERLIVIKEACGNTYVSIILSLILLVIKTLINHNFANIEYIPILEIIFAIFLFLSLRTMHFKVAEQQDNRIKIFLSKLPKQHGTSANPNSSGEHPGESEGVSPEVGGRA